MAPRPDTGERRSPAGQAQRFLAEVGVLLSVSLDYEETLNTVARLTVPRIADWCTVNLLHDDGTIERVAAAHALPEKEIILRQIQRDSLLTPESDHPLSSALRAGRSILLESVSDEQLQAMAQSEQHLELERSLGTRSVVVAPLVIRGRLTGAIALGYTESERRFDHGDVALAEDLARRAATAIDNARLYRDARQAEEQARAHAARFQALAEASRAFGHARLNLDAVLDTVAGQITEHLGDVCVIRLLRGDPETLVPVAMHHRNPEALAFLRRLPASGARRRDVGTTGSVMTTGESFFLSGLPAEEMSQRVISDYVPYVDRFHMHSVMIVPLQVQGSAMGTISTWRDAGSSPYTRDDLLFLEDLADRASLAIDNAQLYREAQDAIRARDEFLSVAAHELKTPITSLRGYAQLLVRQSESDRDVERERLRRSLLAIQTQADKLNALIAQLLDTSRIQSGQLALNRVPIDAGILVREVAMTAQGVSAQHLIIVRTEGDLYTSADPLRLEQVLTNLLDNAIKYSPSGGQVHLDARRVSDDSITISVTDQGIGVPEHLRDRIFDRFYQAHDTGRYGGVGLGLYISRQIAELHGGTLHAEFPEQGGTRFVATLPVAVGS
jgi:signal transduction histidine kinase